MKVSLEKVWKENGEKYFWLNSGTTDPLHHKATTHFVQMKKKAENNIEDDRRLDLPRGAD